MENQELKSCPFCGGEAELVGGPEDWTPTYCDPDSGGIPIAVVCKNLDCSCGLYGRFEDYSDAIKAWNQRTESKTININSIDTFVNRPKF